MKELVILDLDGVIIKGQSQKCLLNYLRRAKIIGLFFYIKIYLFFVFYKLGLVRNPKNVMEYSYALLKGKNSDYIRKIMNGFFDSYLKHFVYPDMIDIIKKHKEGDKELVILSSSADFIVKEVASYLNINSYIATRFEIIDGMFTGNIDKDIVYGKNKINAIERFISAKGLSLKNSWAYADHISDYNLLEIVDNPVATNPDRFLLRKALQKKWKVIDFNK